MTRASMMQKTDRPKPHGDSLRGMIEAVMNANALPRGAELASRKTERINAHTHVLNVMQTRGGQVDSQAFRPRKGLPNHHG